MPRKQPGSTTRTRTDKSVKLHITKAQGIGERVKSSRGGNTFKADDARVKSLLRTHGINPDDPDMVISVGSKGSVTVRSRKEMHSNMKKAGEKGKGFFKKGGSNKKINTKNLKALKAKKTG